MSMKHEFLDTANKFGLVAQQYCSFIDSMATTDKTEFLLRLYRVLPELLTEAIRLPQVEFGEDNYEELEASLRQIRANRSGRQHPGGHRKKSQRRQERDCCPAIAGSASGQGEVAARSDRNA